MPEIEERSVKPKHSLWLLVIPMAVFVVGGVAWREHQKKLAGECSIVLRNYNVSLTSCGVDKTCYEAWADPKKSEELVLRLMGERLPHCPVGGVIRIVCNDPDIALRSYAVCSLAGERGHRNGSVDRERASRRAEEAKEAP